MVDVTDDALEGEHPTAGGAQQGPRVGGVGAVVPQDEHAALGDLQIEADRAGSDGVGQVRLAQRRAVDGQPALLVTAGHPRSEERRVGKEWSAREGAMPSYTDED